MTCPFCDAEVVLVDYGHGTEAGVCDCGARVAAACDPEAGTRGVTWYSPGEEDYQEDDDGEDAEDA